MFNFQRQELNGNPSPASVSRDTANIGAANKGRVVTSTHGAIEAPIAATNNMPDNAG